MQRLLICKFISTSGEHRKKHTLCIWFKIMLERSDVPFSGIASTSHGLSFSISPLSHLQKHEVKNHWQRTRVHPIIQFGLTWLWSTEKGCQDIRTDMVPDKLWTQTTRRHRSQSETDHLKKTKHENQDRHEILMQATKINSIDSVLRSWLQTYSISTLCCVLRRSFDAAPENQLHPAYHDI